MPKNTLNDLNSILFEQLERLNDLDMEQDEVEVIDKEIQRADAINRTSKQIIKNATLALRGKQYLDTYGVERAAVPDVLQLNEGGNRKC